MAEKSNFAIEIEDPIESPQQIALEEEIRGKVDDFLTEFNGSLPNTMELEFEGFYRRGFFVTKKRYAVIEDGNIIAKGLELVRRDWAPIAKKTQENILLAILKEGNVKKAEKIIGKVLKEIKSGRIDRKELVIHTQITKKLDDYKQIGPQQENLKLMESRLEEEPLCSISLPREKAPSAKERFLMNTVKELNMIGTIISSIRYFQQFQE